MPSLSTRLLLEFSPLMLVALLFCFVIALFWLIFTILPLLNHLHFNMTSICFGGGCPAFYSQPLELANITVIEGGL